MDRFTISLGHELYELLKDRAEFNHRSMSQECVFLIECALAAEIDGNREILRTLMMAQGGLQTLKSPQGQGEQTPEHTETDGSLLSSTAKLPIQ